MPADLDVRPDVRRRRCRRLVVGALALCVLLVGATPAVAAKAPKTGRVVAIGEEFLLADLLALGIVPVASTATVDDVGFQGLDDYDTDDIEVLPVWELSIEDVAALRPDTVVTTEFMVEQAGGRERIEGIAENLVVVPSGVDPAGQIKYLGKALGKQAPARRVVRRLAAAERRAKALRGVEVSVATVYPGPSVAAYVAGPSPFVTTLLDAGAVIVPATGGRSTDAVGRIFLSEEQTEQLAAPKLVLLQTDTVDGEPEAVAAIAATPLWKGLPAVSAGAVTTLDRLGYPGAEGQIRLVDDLVKALG